MLTAVQSDPVATGGSGNLDEIPDMDETDTSAAVPSSGLDASNTDMERLKISDDDIPDMDEIPDMDDEGVATMEEEEGDEAEAILVRPTA